MTSREYNPGRDQERAAVVTKTKEDEAVRVEIDDLKWLMNSARGRRIMWKLLAKTHVFATSFTGDNRINFLEGERNVGLSYILAINEHCPDHYITMLKEHRVK